MGRRGQSLTRHYAARMTAAKTASRRSPASAVMQQQESLMVLTSDLLVLSRSSMWWSRLMSKAEMPGFRCDNRRF